MHLVRTYRVELRCGPYVRWQIYHVRDDLTAREEALKQYPAFNVVAVDEIKISDEDHALMKAALRVLGH